MRKILFTMLKKTYIALFAGSILIVMPLFVVSSEARNIDLGDFSLNSITIDFEDVQFTDPHSGNGALSPILDYQSLGVTFFVHNQLDPGVDPKHDIFRLGSWCPDQGISIATNVGVDPSIEVLFEFPVYQIGAVVGVSNAELKLYDRNDDLLEEYQTENVDHSTSTCEFIGIENNRGIYKAVFHDIAFNGLVMSIDDLTFTPIAEIEIDILPKRANNYINLCSCRRIPVAILSTETFSAPNMVDKESLTFGPTGYEESFAFCRQKLRDVNHDGYNDLICVFKRHYTGFKCGDTEGILRGQTIEGTPIEGRDSVTPIPCH